MIRWGVVLVLIGLAVALFLSGSAGGQIVDIGKWLVVAGLVIAVVFALLGGRGSGPGAAFP